MKKLIILRPNQYGNGLLRLALFKEDYREYVQDKSIKTLSVIFDTKKLNVKSLPTYCNHGSLEKASIVSKWLRASGFIEEKNLLLFELTIDNASQSHTYSFLGEVDRVLALVDEAKKQIRKTR